MKSAKLKINIQTISELLNLYLKNIVGLRNSDVASLVMQREEPNVSEGLDLSERYVLAQGRRYVRM